MSKILTVCRKELESYFSSPVAYLFLGTFLAVTFFIFFWVETFFARNIADVRPLFEWMPILLIFLVSALTMRMWSEERRTGTVEVLLTVPVNAFALVLGKFLAVWTLVAIALLLTLPVPFSVSFMGLLDWGPVFGGYLAALLLAASYTAIGLFVSSKSENQIVSLIVSVAFCSVLYLLGSDTLAMFFGSQAAELLSLLGTGSRFEAITRGVIDIRDLYYYFSLTAIFLALNVYGLKTVKWSLDEKTEHKGKRRLLLVTLLVSLNLFAANLWLANILSGRIDLTRGNIYSISPATERYLEQLREPLLIRGYFSAKSHPLLAPLAPQLRDLVREYEVVGKGKVKAEFIDPRENPELEEEANRKYNIRPVPFQVADRYQSSLVNSYFHLLVQYGDQYEVLDFQDLIEVKVRAEQEMDVRLRNPEYDITRSIKKVLYAFQNADSLLRELPRPVRFVGYFSRNELLPEGLPEFREQLTAALESMKQKAPGQFSYSFVEPEAAGGEVAKEIEQEYGLGPMVSDLLSPEPFYFYLTLQDGERFIQLGVPEDLNQEAIERALETGLKRFSAGFLKTVGVVSPEPAGGMQGMPGAPRGKQANFLKERLRQTYQVEELSLSEGVVPDNVDLVLLLSPDGLNEHAVFALDQFLMKGGTVIAATSPLHVEATAQAITAEKKASGIAEWLKHHGILIEEALVLDPQNEAFPIPVERNVGGLTLQEIRLVPYPFFVDVRASGMNQDNGITAGIPQVTLNWPSPVSFVEEEGSNDEGEVQSVALLRSSSESWKRTDTNLQPDFNQYPELGFSPGREGGPFVLAGMREGRFRSLFSGKQSPLLASASNEAADESEAEEQAASPKRGTHSVIERSVDSARIIVFASNEFLADETLELSAAIGSSRYLNSIQLVENAVDWSLEDRGLLSIRGRSHFARTLLPISDDLRVAFEYFTYASAFIGLLLLYGIYLLNRARRKRWYKEIVNQAEDFETASEGVAA